MKYNKLLLSILMATGIFASYNSQAETKQTALTGFSVTDVQIGPMDGDTKASEFSTIITFNYTGVATSDWKFGFYMPRTFNNLKTDKQDINQRLTMQICQVSDPTKCANLVYLKTPIKENDLSAGYTNILGADGKYQLESGQQYQIKLLHNNQWGVGNYNSLPQNFFIDSGKDVANSAPEKEVYHILNYDAKTIESNIVAHNLSDWNNSNDIKPVVNIVPSPVSYKLTKGTFNLHNRVTVHNQLDKDNTVANFFVTDLAKDLSIRANVDNKVATTGIIIKKITNPAEINHNLEGYKVTITDKAIVIEASNNTGALYALQSLRQLWNVSPILANAQMVDYPRFKYRGVEPDPARHFFTVAQLESFIDLMTAHKLNTMHVHFSDDEAFRIGLDNYKDQITKQAGTRGYGKSAVAMMFIQGNLDKTNANNESYASATTEYTGTYSSSDIKELISYANKRGITIIPEIDLPGHARALINAFPNELVDPNDKSQFVSNQGYTDDVLPVCTYNSNISVGPKFTPLINEIVQSTAKMFNNQTTLYAVNNEISVGGDEVSSGAWNNDGSCTGDWAKLDSLGKSHKFFQMLSEQNPNLKISGWHNYIQTEESSLGANIVPAKHSSHVWVWNSSGVDAGQAQAKTLAENGYKVVMAYSDQTYFDLAYTPAIDEPGLYWAAPYLDTYAALHSAVAASQTINGVKKDNQTNIEGIEGTLWSENMPTYNALVYKALPKMAGLSEASWSSASITDNNNLPNWQSLATRLGCGQNGFLNYLNKIYNVQYRGYPNGISLETPANFCK